VIVLNSIFPVFGLILLGTILKRLRFTTDEFLSISDRLVYFVFFPALLFWKIGSASAITVGWSVFVAALCALLAVFALSCLCIRVFKVTDYQAGTFSQSCYRFNTYIGMAVIINALGEEAVGIFGILIGIMIPVINLLAVSTLIWYSGKTYAARERNRLLARSLISNPLIIGCAAGILYANVFDRFPDFIDNTLRLTSFVTLPLALLSIGGNLTFSKFRRYYRTALLATLIKLLVLPLCGYFFLKVFNVNGTPLGVAMIFFALPASTAIFVLSSQLNSDTGLASASIVISTIFSLISLTVVLAAIG
jgi:predicted permease